MVCASFGPTPFAVCSSSNSARSSSSAKPYSVSESSRTTRLVASRAGLAEPQPGQRAGRAGDRQPDAADLDHRAVRAERGDRAADARDHRARLSRAPRSSAGLRRAAPELADRQRQRVGGVGRARGLGQAQQPGDHRPHLRLVRRARPGDGGLDLARRVQRHRDARPGRGDDRQPGDLRGAHHRADVVLAEHPLDGDDVGRDARRSPPRSRRPGPAAGARSSASAAVRTTSTCTSASGRPGRTVDDAEPHRVMPGSTPSTRTASSLTDLERSFDAALRGEARRATRRRTVSVPYVGVHPTSASAGTARAAEPGLPRLRRAGRVSAAGSRGAPTSPGHGSGDVGVFLFVLGGWVVSRLPARVRARLRRLPGRRPQRRGARLPDAQPVQVRASGAVDHAAAVLHRAGRHRPARRRGLPAPARVPQPGDAERGRRGRPGDQRRVRGGPAVARVAQRSIDAFIGSAADHVRFWAGRRVPRLPAGHRGGAEPAARSPAWTAGRSSSPTSTRTPSSGAEKIKPWGMIGVIVAAAGGRHQQLRSSTWSTGSTTASGAPRRSTRPGTSSSSSGRRTCSDHPAPIPRGRRRCAAGALAGCGSDRPAGVPDVSPGRLVSGSFVSALRGGLDTGWTIARPPGHDDDRLPVLVVLHGRGAAPHRRLRREPVSRPVPRQAVAPRHPAVRDRVGGRRRPRLLAPAP